MSTTEATAGTVDPVRFTIEELIAWSDGHRRNTPVFFDEKQGFWQVFGHADVSAALSDPATYSSDFSGMTPTQEDFEIFRKGNFVGMDAPEHRKLRRLVNQAFTPRMMAGLEPRIVAITSELFDGLDDPERFDLMDALAYPLPVIVIAELLGIPAEDRSIFRRWAATLFDGDQLQGDTGPEEIEAALNAVAPTIREMNTYILAHIARCRTNPGDDLTSELLRAEVDGERLDDGEILGFIGLLLVAGHITTTALLGNTILSLAGNPEAAAELRADPALWPAALEEVLRYRTPFARLGRRTTTEVTLSGHVIPANQIVMLYLASANRDETLFPDPDRFDIHRAPNPHLTFGHGVHFCLGAPLARLEAKIALGQLFARYQDIRLDPDAPAVLQNPWVIVGAKQLPLVTRLA
ncbi:cytochrome P450 [Solihabitans fulvus]|uniref:Cytochrome P450 n=1 Tax=Solihabitans fulvus TaxID=1892852 RepID=A0A5B2X237_9PSEU|nr:cytochrome P450 [Solihabitans fulvus]KAA2257269.1 cytochrome P450 [Solihabitans fulvus]